MTGIIKRKRTTQKDRSVVEAGVIEISNLKKKAEAIKKQIADTEGKLIPHLEKFEGEVLEVKHGSETIRAIIVRGDSVVTDEDVLKRKVGATKWKSITTAVLDKIKLGEAIKAGIVSEVDVAAATTLTPKKAFVKVTRK